MNWGQHILDIIKHENLATDDIEFVGCSEAELEQLKPLQQVDFVPATYRELMSGIGHAGIEWLLDGESDYPFVSELKNQVMRMRQPSQHISKDAFIFLGILDAYFFFETQDRSDNPAVYIYYEDQVSLSAATFIEFIETKIQMRRKEKDKRIEDEKRSIYYNPESNSFYTNLPDD